MANYKYMSEDDHAFSIQHEDGSSFKVAKKGLSKATQDKIKKMNPNFMPDGGVVPDPSADQYFSPEYQSSNPNVVEQVGSPTNQVITIPQQPVESTEPYANTPVVQPVPQPKESTYIPGQKLQASVSKPDIVDQAIASPNQSTQPSPEAARAPSEASQPVQKQVPPAAGQDLMGDYQALTNQEKEALQKKGQNELESGLAQERAQSLAAKSNEAGANQLQIELNKNSADAEAIKQKMNAQGDLIGRSYWNSLGTGQKIGSALAIALSGLGGGGANGTPNMAMQVINNAAAEDLQRQQASIGVQKTLLSDNLARYGHLPTAIAATASLHASAVKNIIDASVARAGGMNAPQNMKLLQVQADKNLLDAKMKYSGELLGLKGQGVMNGQSGVGGLTDQEKGMYSLTHPKEADNLYKPMSDTQNYFVNGGEKEKSELLKKDQLYPQISSILQQLDDIGATAPLRAKNFELAQGLRAQVAPMLAAYNNYGTKIPMVEKMEETFGNPTSFKEAWSTGDQRTKTLKPMLDYGHALSKAVLLKGYPRPQMPNMKGK